MKQVLNSFKTGSIEIAELPIPHLNPGELLIRTNKSAISSGTERMLIEFGKASYLDKARRQPEQLSRLLNKIKVVGFAEAIRSATTKLSTPFPMGYCNVGVVIDNRSSDSRFQVGDRVVSNGPHAEYVCVPSTLCAKVPDGVTDEEAAFTVLAAIALQGIRLANPTIGERAVVFGTGLIGLFVIQILRAHGCSVLALDYNAERLEVARHYGAETLDLNVVSNPTEAAVHYSSGRGVDFAILTTDTDSNDPIRLAAEMCRRRGRIILVGVSGLELSRADFYKKELTFQVSSSYGPGRYDKSYEQDTLDYPYDFVRWTAQRNFEAILGLFQNKRLDVQKLITHIFRFESIGEAYRLIQRSGFLGILIDYGGSKEGIEDSKPPQTNSVQSYGRGISSEPIVGFLGAGNYARGVLMPAYQLAGATLYGVVSKTGLGAHSAKKIFGFDCISSDVDEIISSEIINTIVIATQHDSHAGLVVRSLKCGKHTFVEKPLCLTQEELSDIASIATENRHSHPSSPLLMIGFNRRFSPLSRLMKDLISTKTAPMSMIMTVNAGKLEKDSWILDQHRGGGRIIGEVCHFLDLFRYLSGCRFKDWSLRRLHGGNQESVIITAEFEDGSIGVINYFTNGHRSVPKERLEIFKQDAVLRLDDFKKLTGYGFPSFKSKKLWSQDKGQRACVKAFVDAIRIGGPSPIPLEEIIEVSQVTLNLAAS